MGHQVAINGHFVTVQGLKLEPQRGSSLRELSSRVLTDTRAKLLKFYLTAKIREASAILRNRRGCVRKAVKGWTAFR